MSRFDKKTDGRREGWPNYEAYWICQTISYGSIYQTPAQWNAANKRTADFSFRRSLTIIDN